MNLQIQESEGSLRQNNHKSTLRHIMVKLLKTKNKEKQSWKWGVNILFIREKFECEFEWR